MSKTQELLDRAKKALEGTSPAPWVPDIDEIHEGDALWTGKFYTGENRDTWCTYLDDNHPRHIANVRFTGEARSLVPLLVAAVEAHGKSEHVRGLRDAATFVGREKDYPDSVTNISADLEAMADAEENASTGEPVVDIDTIVNLNAEAILSVFRAKRGS